MSIVRTAEEPIRLMMLTIKKESERMVAKIEEQAGLVVTALMGLMFEEQGRPMIAVTEEQAKLMVATIEEQAKLMVKMVEERIKLITTMVQERAALTATVKERERLVTTLEEQAELMVATIKKQAGPMIAIVKAGEQTEIMTEIVLHITTELEWRTKSIATTV